MMNIEWDADKYTKDFSFVNQYGTALLDMIDGENLSVLDLGCGNGSLTKKLIDAGFEAEGMDASDELLKTARETYPDINFLSGDATEFSVDNKYDVVFSNAVFHWIDKEKQLPMLENVYNALKNNGQFIFEMGGYGNNAIIHEALKTEFDKRSIKYVMPFYFPTIGEYTQKLEQAGFRVRSAVLFDRPTELNGCNGLYDWIHMFVKTPFIGVAEEIQEDIINSAVMKLKPELFKDGKWYADYVRLRCKAIKK